MSSVYCRFCGHEYRDNATLTANSDRTTRMVKGTIVRHGRSS
jgi:hypothetical protein